MCFIELAGIQMRILRSKIIQNVTLALINQSHSECAPSRAIYQLQVECFLRGCVQCVQ